MIDRISALGQIPIVRVKPVKPLDLPKCYVLSNAAHVANSVASLVPKASAKFSGVTREGNASNVTVMIHEI